MNAASIAAALGNARREGRAWRCRCPLHGGCSLVLRDGYDGCVLVTCFGGCDRLDVLAELRRSGLLDGPHGDRMADHRWERRRSISPQNDATRIRQAREIWEGALPTAESPVARYLVSRGITMPPPPSLRWSPKCWHGPLRQPLPAMIAVVEHVERGIVGVHRTYLRSDGCGKADLVKEWQKRTLGPIGGGAVRLGMPSEDKWLAVGEGLETVLAVMTACDIPGWAALSGPGIRALILPPEATHVIICADHDGHGVGQRAANDAATRWLAEGRRVRLALPPQPDTDFNDVLCDPTEARNVA
jgi:hypothetical protein